MLYAVTGGTGFLGSHVVEQLLSSGHSVRLLIRSTPPVPESRQNVELVEGSVLERRSLARLVGGVEGVFHLAGVVEHMEQRADAMFRANVHGTLNVLEASREAAVRRIVYSSTSGTVGVSVEEDKIADESSPYAYAITKSWPYYRSKIEAEEKALKFSAENNMDLVCIRPSLLLGPGDFRLSSCRSILNLLERRIPFVPRGGLSYVDVRDAASAFISAMECKQPNKTYLLGAKNLTCQEYFGQVANISGVPGPWLKIPSTAAWALASTAFRLKALFGQLDPSLSPILVEMSQHFWYIDSTKAFKDLGFMPRAMDKTLKDTIHWLQENREHLNA